MKKLIDNYIQELKDTITAAELNYQVWWVLKGKETRERFSPTMNRYSPYFQTAIHAHFVATLAALYRLYETCKDTYNINLLRENLEKSGKFQKVFFNTIDKKLEEIKPLWIKVNILRNKAFGHRFNEMSINEVFKQADMTPNELKDLISKSKELLNEISYKWDKSGFAFNANSDKSTINLLKELKEYHKILSE